MASKRISILVLLFSLILLHPFPPPAQASTPVVLTVFSEDSSSPNLISPYLVVGTSFNMTIQASNLPIITGQSGGLAGFDISLSYNASLVKAENASFAGPFCPSSDGCVFDLPTNDTLTLLDSLNSPPGTTRIAMLGLGPSNRAVLPTLVGVPPILFRIQFDVVGKGLSPVDIQPSSRLLGYTDGCGTLLPYTVINGSIDNRPPFTISATPPSATVRPGSSASVLVNVTLVNSAGNGLVDLTLSGYTRPLYNSSLFSFTPLSGTLDASQGLYSFTSKLTINTNSSAPLGMYNLTIIGVIPPPSPNHYQYNLNFTLTLSLTATSLNQATLPTFASVQSNPTPLTLPSLSTLSLLASFTSTSPPRTGSPVTFTAVAVWCASPPYTLHWNFGDGTTSTSNPATHTYNSPGTFTVTLTVTETNGTAYSTSESLTISPGSGSNLFFLASLGAVVTLVVLGASIAYLRRPRARSRSRKG